MTASWRKKEEEDKERIRRQKAARGTATPIETLLSHYKTQFPELFTPREQTVGSLGTTPPVGLGLGGGLGGGGISPVPEPQFNFSWNNQEPKESFEAGVGRVKDLEVSQALGTFERQKNTAKQRGLEVPDTQPPNLLERIFDVLSRPNYAMAEGVKRSSSQKKAGDKFVVDDFFKGLVGGITGKDKTSFADVLEQEGVTNPWVKNIGGFILDVALDPTTYVGAGLIKKAGQEGIHRVAMQAVDEIDKEVLDKIGREARLKFQKGNAKNLKKLPEEKRNEKLADIAGHAQADHVAKVYEDKFRELFNEDATKISLRFAGREVGSLGTDRFQYFWRPVQDTKLHQALRTRFSTEVDFPGRINHLWRQFQGRSVGDYYLVEQKLDSLLKGSTKAERIELTHAIEEGRDLGSRLTSGGVPMEEIKTVIHNMNKQWGAIEQDWKVLDEIVDVGNSRYLHHIIKEKKGGGGLNKFKDERRRAFNRKTSQEYAIQNPFAHGPSKTRSFPSIKAAKEAGFIVEEDIGRIMKSRSAKHQLIINRNAFEHAIIEEFGLDSDNLNKLIGVAEKTSPSAKAKVLSNLNLVPYRTKNTKQEVWIPEFAKKSLEIIDKPWVLDEASKAINEYSDKALQAWKTAVTVVNPGHHVRNFIGDTFFNYLDGVPPKAYREAVHLYKALNDMNHHKKIKLGKNVVDIQVLAGQYIDKGLKTGYTRAELPGATKIAALEKAKRYTEIREDFPRMAHFLHSLRQQGKKVDWKSADDISDLSAAAFDAATIVRHGNIDYGKLTKWEQEVAKKWIPFYTFMRHNIPLMLESLALRPGRFLAVDKGKDAIERVLGADTPDDTRATLPQWIRDMYGIQISGGSNPMFLSPNLPLNDLMRLDITNPKGMVQDAISSMSPGRRILAEIGFGKTAFSGAPLGTPTNYMANQLPMSRVLYSAITGNENADTQAANWASGLGLQQATPNRRMAEVRRQEDVIERLLKEYEKKQKEQIFGY